MGAAAAGGRLLFLGGEWETDLEGLLLWGGLLWALGGVAELEALLFLSGWLRVLLLLLFCGGLLGGEADRDGDLFLASSLLGRTGLFERETDFLSFLSSAMRLLLLWKGLLLEWELFHCFLTGLLFSWETLFSTRSASLRYSCSSSMGSGGGGGGRGLGLQVRHCQSGAKGLLVRVSLLMHCRHSWASHVLQLIFILPPFLPLIRQTVQQSLQAFSSRSSFPDGAD